MLIRSLTSVVSTVLVTFGTVVTSAAGAEVQASNAHLATAVLGGPVGAAVDGFGISKSGRYMVFATGADDVVPGVDSGNEFQIYWLDRKTGATKIVSVNANGQVANDRCSEPTVSDDGKHVVFLSQASNLGFPSNGKEQVYYADLASGALKMISTAPNDQPGSERAWYPDISGDGLVATFTNASPNMLPFLTPHMHVFVYDAKTDQLEIASVNNDDHFANDISLVSHLSKDGRYVVFESDATNLPDDTVALSPRRIVLRDRKTETTSILSRGQNDTPANSSAFSAAMTEDGRYVAFLSYASNLTADQDSSNTQDVFVVDRKSGKVKRMAGQFDDGMEEFALDISISNDGRRVAVGTYYKPPKLMGSMVTRGHVYDRVKKAHAVIESASPDLVGTSDALQYITLARSGNKLFFNSKSPNLDLQGAQTQQVFVLGLKGM